MNKLSVVLICFGCLMGNLIPAQAQENQQGQIIETESHSVFKGLFLKVWGRLKSMNPTQKQSAKAAQSYTAGIRGAESTDTLLKPYWKNDLTQDETFQAELQLFSDAQLKMDKGDLESAAKAFGQFIAQYQTSSLRPNALFGRSISLAGIGKTEDSKVVMQLFIDENPNHPLIADARQILGELSA